MKLTGRTSIFSAVCAGIALNTGALAAAFQAQSDYDGVLITPELDYQAARVTLNGPLGTEQLEFGAGEAIFIPAPSLDGSFSYRVALTPSLSESQASMLSGAPRDGSGPTLFTRDETIYSGFLYVDGGILVDGTLQEARSTGGLLKSDTDDGNALAAPAPDPSQVIAGDATIRFSLCVGGDCADAESYGSDTVRLKENNLRIHFDDTSSSGAFARNDWRLVANESNNGGAEMFAIEDVSAGRYVAYFEAGAPNHALHVSNQGHLGISTNSPAEDIHVSVTDTPTLRLEQDGTSWPEQIWDVSANESNFFLRDNSHGHLPLRIYPSAYNDNSLTVDPQGQVGIGLPDFDGSGIPLAAATLHVRARDVAGDALMIIEKSNGSDVLTLTEAGDLVLEGTLAQLSREDSKEHFQPVHHAQLLQRLKSLPISTWNYRHQPDDERHLGPMAGAFYDAYGLGTDPQHIATSDMAAVALASAQALILEVEARDARIGELETRLRRLESFMVQVLENNPELDTQLVSR